MIKVELNDQIFGGKQLLNITGESEVIRGYITLYTINEVGEQNSITISLNRYEFKLIEGGSIETSNCESVKIESEVKININNTDEMIEKIKKIISADEKVNNQIKKAMDINCQMTSEYNIKLSEINIYNEGIYVVLTATRAGKKMFIDNNNNIIRKPRNIELLKTINIDKWLY